MRERGILFSDEMVRALLAGTKTQTRRTVKLPSWTADVSVDRGGTIWGPGPYLKAHRAEPVPDDVGAMERVHCPYGYPGDRLWVREAWRVHRDVDHVKGSDLATHAIGLRRLVAYEADGVMATQEGNNLGRYRHARFMPRWASRITLEITEVRAQRLQDISEEDARTEGLSQITKDGGRTIKWGIPDRDGYPGTDDVGWPWAEWNVSARVAYRTLWERINGAGSWAANPWCWAITFKRVDASSRAA